MAGIRDPSGHAGVDLSGVDWRTINWRTLDYRNLGQSILAQSAQNKPTPLPKMTAEQEREMWQYYRDEERELDRLNSKILEGKINFRYLSAKAKSITSNNEYRASPALAARFCFADYDPTVKVRFACHLASLMAPMIIISQNILKSTKSFIIARGITAYSASSRRNKHQTNTKIAGIED